MPLPPYPLTAERLTLRMMNFWNTRNTKIGGTITMNRIENLMLLSRLLALMTYL